jgi:hypothetical protein
VIWLIQRRCAARLIALQLVAALRSVQQKLVCGGGACEAPACGAVAEQVCSATRGWRLHCTRGSSCADAAVRICACERRRRRDTVRCGVCARPVRFRCALRRSSGGCSTGHDDSLCSLRGARMSRQVAWRRPDAWGAVRSAAGAGQQRGQPGRHRVGALRHTLHQCRPIRVPCERRR